MVSQRRWMRDVACMVAILFFTSVVVPLPVFAQKYGSSTTGFRSTPAAHSFSFSNNNAVRVPPPTAAPQASGQRLGSTATGVPAGTGVSAPSAQKLPESVKQVSPSPTEQSKPRYGSSATGTTGQLAAPPTAKQDRQVAGQPPADNTKKPQIQAKTQYGSTATGTAPLGNTGIPSDAKQAGKQPTGISLPKASTIGQTPVVSAGGIDTTVNKRFQDDKAKKALAEMRAQDAKKLNVERPNPVAVTADSARQSPLYQHASRGGDRQMVSYIDRRRVFYRDYTPPVYVSLAPSYGLWSGLFLGMMLERALDDRRYAEMYHHHYNDPGMAAWRAEMHQQAATNTELRTRLTQLEQQAGAMNNIPRNAAYVPKDIDADMMLSTDVVVGMAPTFRMCVAGKDGNYHAYGAMIQQAVDTSRVQIVLINTEGSEEILRKLQIGECDGGLAQRNAFWVYAERNPQSGGFPFERILSPYNEYVHVACNRQANVTDFGQLDEKFTLYGAIHGSGTELTFVDFKTLAPKYGAPALSAIDNVERVKEETNACMVFVAGLNSPKMIRLDEQYGDSLKLIHVTSGAFLKGKDPSGKAIYEKGEIPSENYVGMQDRRYYVGSSSVTTVKTPADLLGAKQFANDHHEAYQAFIDGAIKALPMIRHHVGGGA